MTRIGRGRHRCWRRRSGPKYFGERQIIRVVNYKVYEFPLSRAPWPIIALQFCGHTTKSVSRSATFRLFIRETAQGRRGYRMAPNFALGHRCFRRCCFSPSRHCSLQPWSFILFERLAAAHPQQSIFRRGWAVDAATGLGQRSDTLWCADDRTGRDRRRRCCGHAANSSLDRREADIGPKRYWRS